MYWSFKRVVGVGNGNYIYFWKYKGLSDENTTAPTTSDYSLNQQLSYFGTKTKSRIQRKLLKARWNYIYSWKIVNVYTIYEIRNNNTNKSYYPLLKNCLFGAVSLAKTADIDKYKYLGYWIEFDGNGSYSHPSGGMEEI